MPKYYCDYCDIFLTHDSTSVRKAHNSGWKHKEAVYSYYRNLSAEQRQAVIDSVVRSHEQGIAAPQGWPGVQNGFAPPHPIPPLHGFPPNMARPPPPPPFGGPHPPPPPIPYPSTSAVSNGIPVPGSSSVAPPPPPPHMFSGPPPGIPPMPPPHLLPPPVATSSADVAGSNNRQPQRSTDEYIPPPLPTHTTS